MNEDKNKSIFSRLAKYLGYKSTIDKQSNSSKSVYYPSSAETVDELQDFIHYFNSKQKFNSLEEKRKISYQTFSRMDESMSEVSMSLDTYADEMFSSGLLEDPFEFNIEGVDEEDKEKLFTILDRNNIKANARADGRNLCKFGDLGYKIYLPKEGKDIDEMVILPFSPDKWKVEVLDEITLIPIKYTLSPTNDSTIKDEELNIFEFIQFSVSDNEFKPYGRSLLDGIAIPADQLKTLESLLALSRASRIERLIIKVPTDEANPVASLQKLSSVKNQIKNTVFQDQSGNSKSINKIPSLLDTLYIPKDGFEIDKLTSSVDLSTTEDVEYFRDKLILALRLPKGFLTTADESTFSVGKDGKLAAMDLKFARALHPFQKSYIDGLQKMCFVIMYHILRSSGKNYNLSEVSIDIKLRKPPQVALEMMDVYKGIGEAANEIIQSYRSALGGTTDDEDSSIKITKDQYKNLLIKIGMPRDIANLFSLEQEKNKLEKNNLVESINKTQTINSGNLDLFIKTLENISNVDSEKEELKEDTGYEVKLKTNYNE